MRERVTKLKYKRPAYFPRQSPKIGEVFLANSKGQQGKGNDPRTNENTKTMNLSSGTKFGKNNRNYSKCKLIITKAERIKCVKFC